MNEDTVEDIVSGETVLALILRANFNKEGIHFFTPADFSQQLAHMRRPAGYLIQPHVHNALTREVHYTKEVLFIRRGRLRVDFYDEQQRYVRSALLTTGDVILLAYGGHGFEMLEECEIVEVKQGPYAGESDKTRFLPPKPNKLIWS